jgi:hypothetical protein
MRDRESTLAANEPALDATSSQTAPWTHIRCIQSPEAWAVRKKLDSLLVRTDIEQVLNEKKAFILL